MAAFDANDEAAAMRVLGNVDDKQKYDAPANDVEAVGDSNAANGKGADGQQITWWVSALPNSRG